MFFGAFNADVLEVDGVQSAKLLPLWCDFWCQRKDRF
jgi:hypothetical protein